MRSHWIWLLSLVGTAIAAPVGVDSLPVGSAPAALEAPHFPSRLHAFVWRNWECANLDRMAQTVRATPEQIAAIGRSMGLPPHQPVSEAQLGRSYISVIRRNWHLLPYEQLLTLLGWDADKLAYTLKEDDFLWIKLGLLKPSCPLLKYAPAAPAVRKRCDEIKELVQARFGEELRIPAEPRFAFVRELSEAVPETSAGNEPAAHADDEPIRFLYSYFAVYGDPLTEEGLDPYPEGLLQRLRCVGVNGVWLHVVLRQLAPSRQFPEFGEGWQTRLVNLRKLVERAEQHGIKIYLYMNEPRAMPETFFENRPEMKGAEENRFFAMCTSVPAVREWMTEALRHVFREVPGLGGVFTITASENLTNCWSRGGGGQCPRCAKRSPADVIVEVNRAIADGVRAGSPTAKTIVWDWGWHNDWCESIIPRLPKDVYLMSVSEWDLPVSRGGVSTRVGEYSLSAVGPGPRARRNWALARQAGLKIMAKIQANCTWELSAVPYLPVMDLVARHCEGLAACNVDGTMLSWTLGGYPSPNLELVNLFARRPAPTARKALLELASRRYGSEAAPDALEAWSSFSSAFSEFPYHGTFLYAGPMQWGPANLLYAEPTGYRASMVGFPYDDVNGWRAVYPAEVLAGQLGKTAEGWKQGLERWKQVLNKAGTARQRESAISDHRLASAAGLHFASAANQVRFIIAREAARAASRPDERRRQLARMGQIAREEMEVASRMFPLARQDSRIGYEASNHYYYYPLDMVEKVIGCEYILAHLQAAEKSNPQ